MQPGSSSYYSDECQMQSSSCFLGFALFPIVLTILKKFCSCQKDDCIYQSAVVRLQKGYQFKVNSVKMEGFG